MAVHHAVGISRQRNSGYRPSRVDIMAQGLFTPDPSLNPTHLSIRRGRATTTHYTHHQVSLMVSRNTTLVPSLGLRIGPAANKKVSVLSLVCPSPLSDLTISSPNHYDNAHMNNHYDCIYIIVFYYFIIVYIYIYLYSSKNNSNQTNRKEQKTKN